MTVVVGIIAFFLILALLILVHEAGHFAFAKLMRVRVDEFGLGFPPRLKSWYWRGTRYSINAIPLGGFVKMLGENGAAAEPDSFGAKAPWRRLVILAAGPTMNLILAVVIFFSAFLWGSPRGLTVITGVAAGSPASIAGLLPNDTIRAVNGKRVTYLDQLLNVTQNRAGQPTTLRIQRGTSNFTVRIVPRLHPPPHQGAIGINLDRFTIIRYAPQSAFRMSFQEIGAAVQNLPQIFQSLSHPESGSVQGPIGIAQSTTQVVGSEPSLGPGSVLYFIAILSVSLGVINLLPIPALDGGRIVFVVLSFFRRRNLAPEVEGLIHLVGMAALLLLILFVSYQDIAHILGGSS